ncbi:hypothetical protein [Amycolatopsis sp. NPDC051372]
MSPKSVDNFGAEGSIVDKSAELLAVSELFKTRARERATVVV